MYVNLIALYMTTVFDASSQFRLLSTPCSVMRRTTRNLVERLVKAGSGSSLDNRVIMSTPVPASFKLVLTFPNSRLGRLWEKLPYVADCLVRIGKRMVGHVHPEG